MKMMKRMVAALLALTVLMSCVAMAETYVEFTANARGYKSKGGKKSDVVIKKGSVSYTDEDDIDGKWVKVYVDEENELWFKTSNLEESDEEEQRILYVSGGSGRSTNEDEDEAESYKTSKKYVYATGKCNIRKTPALDGKRLGTLKKGATLKYLGKRAEDARGVYWYKVRTKSGKTGWVSEAFTKLK